MNIKDFKPGQTAFILIRKRGRETQYLVNQCKVISVGRKYVKVAPKGNLLYPVEYYLHEKTDDHLTEKRDWGEYTFLFPTEEAINNAVERDKLRIWLRKETEGYKLYSYTLEQLRAVRDILGGKDNGEEKEV